MEIIPGIHMIDDIIAHCYLIDEKNLTLIDTGIPHKTKKILYYITNILHKNPTDLKTILLTHCDFDHIGSAFELRNHTGAKIAAHPRDAEVIAGKITRVIPQAGIRILLKQINKVMRVKPFDVDILIQEGDQIAGFTVLDMPGHTIGSIALYDPNRKILFIGDTLDCKAGIVYGPSKTMSTDIMQAYRSIEKLKNLDFTIMLSGHGQPLMSNASAKVTEFINHIKKE